MSKAPNQISSTGQGQIGTDSRPSRFGQQFSNASVSTLATVDTVLPEYSEANADRHVVWRYPSGFDAPSSTAGGDRNRNFSHSPPSEPPTCSLQESYNPFHATSLTQPFFSTTVARPHDFQYSFHVRSNKPWATLHLYTRDSVPGNTRPSRTQSKLPRIWGCDPIDGLVELDLNSPQTIKEIKIILRGKIVTSSLDGGSSQFLSTEFTLLKGKPGYNGQSNAISSKAKPDRKLVGKHFFPFCLPFPTHVDLSSKSATLKNDRTIRPFTPAKDMIAGAETSSSLISSTTSGNGDLNASYSTDGKRNHIKPPAATTPIPQTFVEKGVTASIVYELSVLFVHGRFRPDDKIKTNISYLPALQPLPASQGRRDAYAAGALIPYPMNDPNGWFALPPATTHGIFQWNRFPNQWRQTKIRSQLYLAKPLSYTRGTVIPCFLTLLSDDVEALCWLSSSNIATVKLMRRLRHVLTPHEEIYDTGQGLGFNSTETTVSSAVMFVPGTVAIGKNMHFKTMLHEMTTAQWWPPSKEILQESNIRHLEGEIHLSADLEPSCACEFFNVEYYVEMRDLRSAHFEPKLERHGKERAMEQAAPVQVVEILTLHRVDEPVPITYSETSKLMV